MRITLLGDFAPVCRGSNYLLDKREEVRNYLHELFRESDLVFANLETPITNSEKKAENKRFSFKMNPELTEVFPPQLILSIANNHILDFGDEGLSDTIKNLKIKGILFTGAGKNINEAGTPVIVKCKNKQVGFIASADKRYKSATEENYGVFPSDLNVLIPKIKELKKQVNLLFLSIHMGMEYIPVPTPAMMEMAKQSHEAGADVVFFHHTHCLSGVTLRENHTTLWGLGNFIFPEKKNNPFKPWIETAAFHFNYADNQNDISLDIIPYRISEVGLPEKPDTATREKIISRIEKLSREINSGKSLIWLRWINIIKPSYLQIAFSNYLDIARRQGITGMFRQIFSSIQVLFFKK